MGVTEMTKLHYLCKKFRGSVMNISADGYYARMDLPYVFSDGCRAILYQTYGPEEFATYACPYCRRYVHKISGRHICARCHKLVDCGRLRPDTGKIVYDGGRSWLDVKRSEE